MLRPFPSEEAVMSVQGRIVWHDLMTKDLEASRRFYGALFGWRFVAAGPMELIEGPAGEHHFGAMMALDAAAPMPSHWVPYVAVNDLDAALATVPKAGGRLHTRVMEAGQTGRFAVVGDPHGAVVTAFQYTASAPKPERDAPPPPGLFCWDELMTPDPDAAAAFYATVFGLGVEHLDMPDFGRYSIFLRDAVDAEGKRRNAAGMMKMPPGVPHPFWLSYVAVADCDAAVAKAQALGATPTSPPMNVECVGRFATLLDPQMAPFAVLAGG